MQQKDSSQVSTLWRIQMFGGLRAADGEHTITRFATSRTAALLARLALFPHHLHSREELADLLWPEADPEAGRLSLRVAVASLRRQLEPPPLPAGSVLIADRSAVRLDPLACRTDVFEFEDALKAASRASDPAKKRQALDQALALFEGELLPGFYDEWILEEQERLNALYEDARRQQEKLPSALPTFTPPGEVVKETSTLGNFPLQFTRGFGHERECAQTAALLRDAQTRLVTLTGPGGAGKTRLAGEVARLVRADFAGPICFVPLADLIDAALFPDAVVGALGMVRSADREPLEQIVATLSAQPPALLVFDNLEHLMERSAPILWTLLTRLPTLTCLVTSRRRLMLPGERELPVPPLALPCRNGTPEQVLGAASVALFVDRAQAARPDFQLTRGNAEAVSDLCRSLEGLPLAIELVAARAMSLTPTQMNERLGERFALLASRRGDKGGRHRSLWAAISWSYDLLPPALQRFFTRLSVFRGGCTAEAAEAVCEEPEALEFLTQLRERSLLVIEEHGAEMRFRLLETLREFAEEHLSAEERHALGYRHAAFLIDLAAQMETLRSGPKQKRALEILDAESDNLRAALAFCSSHSGNIESHAATCGLSELGLRLAGSLGHYWSMRGLLREGLGWLESALAGEGSDTVQAKALAEAGWMAAGMGEYDKAETALTQAIVISRQSENIVTLADALRKRGVAAVWRSDNERAGVDLEEALALSRTLGDEAGIAAVLNSLGVLADQLPGGKAKARALYEEALILFRKCGDQRWESYCLHNLGNIALDFGAPDQAIALLRQSLALTDALGDLWQRAYCLRSLGDVIEAQGDLVGAAQILEEGRTLCRHLGDRMSEAGTICSLAVIARRQNLLEQAHSLSQAALALYREMRHTHGVALCLLDLIEIAAAQGRWARVAGLLGAKDAACSDAPFAEETRTRFASMHEKAREALGDDSFQAAWVKEEGLSLDECAAYALED